MEWSVKWNNCSLAAELATLRVLPSQMPELASLHLCDLKYTKRVVKQASAHALRVYHQAAMPHMQQRRSLDTREVHFHGCGI